MKKSLFIIIFMLFFWVVFGQEVLTWKEIIFSNVESKQINSLENWWNNIDNKIEKLNYSLMEYLNDSKKAILDIEKNNINRWLSVIVIIIWLFWFIFVFNIYQLKSEYRELLREFKEDRKNALNDFEKEKDSNLWEIKSFLENSKEEINSRMEIVINQINSRLDNVKSVSDDKVVEESSDLSILLQSLLKNNTTNSIKEENINDKTDPQDYRVWFKIWLDYSKNKEDRKALEAFEKAEKLDQWNLSIKISKWDVLRNLWENDKAIIEYDFVLNKDSTNQYALMWKWMALMNKGRNKEALEMFNKVKNLNSLNVWPYIFGALIYYWNSNKEDMKKEYDVILGLLDKELKQFPNDKKLLEDKWILLTSIMTETDEKIKNHKIAKNIFENILELYPWDNFAQYELTQINKFLEANKK